METEVPLKIKADAPTEVFGGSIILINPTDCCIPTVKVTTPWNSVEVTKIKDGQTITFKNETNQHETYSIRSAGKGVQYAVPKSGWTEDTIINVKLYVIYIKEEPTFPVTILSQPPNAIISIV